MSRLIPPADGATVRMYRQGHGDCFLLAFPRTVPATAAQDAAAQGNDARAEDPVYVLIDCGYKPGSQVHSKKSQEIVDHIVAATGSTLDLMVVTHEHQDHLNIVWKRGEPYFEPFTIRKAWLAWTEDPDDELAETLRERHRDQLLGLMEARRRLALAVGEDDGAVRRLDGFLEFELGGEDETFNLAAADPEKSVNKQALKLIKDKARAHDGVDYLSPGTEPVTVPGTDVRVYVLGPPRSEELLRDEDPRDGEGFHQGDGAAHGLSFREAVDDRADSPFPRRFGLPLDRGLRRKFFKTHYGRGESKTPLKDKAEVASDAPWRRIDDAWLHSAESLALKLNSGINNTSLVLAFELPKSKKVLLFVGDAQRGNWVSWSEHAWDEGDRTVTARDLLGRTVLYKVGHHGSHNATLAGTAEDAHPNLGWIARNAPPGEFCAMITAVRKWAIDKNNPPWNHPLPSIAAALASRTAGRVLQTDTDEPTRPDHVSEADWERFTRRLNTKDKLCFDLEFRDE